MTRARILNRAAQPDAGARFSGAALPGRCDAILVRGQRVSARTETLPPGREVCVARVVVAPGETVAAELPPVVTRH